MVEAEVAGSRRRFEMLLERNGHVLSVALSGEIDMAAVREIDPRLDEAIGFPTDYIVLDLGAVSFIDSTGLRMLLRLRNQLNGECLLLGRLSHPVQRLLEITKLTNKFAYLNGAPPEESVCPWCGGALRLSAHRCDKCGGAF